MIPTPDRPRVGTAYGVAGGWSGGRHGGVDFPCPSGTTVVAPWAGQVVEVGRTSWGSAYGTAVLLAFDPLPDGKPGLWGILAHNSRVLVKPGQRVAAGTPLARSGATGNVTGPHCHFEVQTGRHWRSGAHVNPKPWLDAGANTPGGSTVSSSSDDYLSLKATDVRKIRTNTDVAIPISGRDHWEAETPSGRHMLALYVNLDLPDPGPLRDALWYGGLRTWYQQIGSGEPDITGLDGPWPLSRFGSQHALKAHAWPHTVDRDDWQFMLHLYAFDAQGNPVNFDLEMETREVKIIGDKT
jgi:hypothetical protein